jgi:hypothetical protein
LPTGLTIGLAGEKAAQPSDAAQEVPVGGETLRWSLKLGGKDLDRCLRHVRRGVTIAAGGIPQS